VTRRDHVAATLLVLAGALLTAWQCWYIYLPLEEALTVDLCRLKPTLPQLDCFDALHRSGFGAELYAWVLPVFPALLGLCTFQLLLCAFAWTAPPARREAWIAMARLVSFPVSGLAVFVVLNDLAWGGGVTSPSAVLLLAATLAMSVLAVVRGWSGVRLGAGAASSVVFLGTAVLLAFFVHGAGNARREAGYVQRARTAAPPDVRLPAFARGMPRHEAARLGDPRAETEVLLFLDGSDASKQAMRDALRLVPDDATAGALVYFYAPGELGAQLLAAQKRGDVRRFLAGSGDAGAPEPDAALERALARQEKAREALGITAYPTVVWREGRATGTLALDRLLRPAE